MHSAAELDSLMPSDMYLPESSSHADTRSMDIEVSVIPLCYKCDRLAIAFGEGRRPLCPRHATILVTAPRVIERNRALEQDEPLSDQQAS